MKEKDDKIKKSVQTSSACDQNAILSVVNKHVSLKEGHVL